MHLVTSSTSRATSSCRPTIAPLAVIPVNYLWDTQQPLPDDPSYSQDAQPILLSLHSLSDPLMGLSEALDDIPLMGEHVIELALRIGITGSGTAGDRVDDRGRNEEVAQLAQINTELSIHARGGLHQEVDLVAEVEDAALDLVGNDRRVAELAAQPVGAPEMVLRGASERRPGDQTRSNTYEDIDDLKRVLAVLEGVGKRDNLELVGKHLEE